ncbi:unnamed protein product [Strongylus vulgaris]|uniref:Uncharacterized protein n=1 Tax=Strongylus vulgaris TaxID=40348 RepID=A0A3P7J3U0_STRVU|nr:unnamed protein product [Strongylus vulgaris]
MVCAEPSDFVPQLYTWAAKDNSNELLRAYSFGLLASALEAQGNAHKYRLNNIDLLPVALRRLAELKTRMFEERALAEQQNATNGEDQHRSDSPGPFSNVNGLDTEEMSSDGQAGGNSSNENTRLSGKKTEDPVALTAPRPRAPSLRVQPPAAPTRVSPDGSPPPKKKKKMSKNERKTPVEMVKVPSLASLHNFENSNSTWNVMQPYVIGTHKIYPLSITMHQRLILQYLIPTGEYQDVSLS